MAFRILEMWAEIQVKQFAAYKSLHELIYFSFDFHIHKPGNLRPTS